MPGWRKVHPTQGAYDVELYSKVPYFRPAAQDQL